jgi:hypothetical protein
MGVRWLAAVLAGVFITAAASVASAQGAAATGRSVTPLVLGGFMANGGGGLAVGGGVRRADFLSNEKYGLQIDGLWSNVGHCGGCDDIPGFDYSSSQISIAGAFLYMLNEMNNGWQPHFGGGLVFVRWSVSWDNDIFGVPIGFDGSGTNAGVQAQFGMTKERLSIDLRAQGAAGGGFVALAGYSF